MYLPCHITVITQETYAISLECQVVSHVQPLSHSVHVHVKSTHLVTFSCCEDSSVNYDLAMI